MAKQLKKIAMWKYNKFDLGDILVHNEDELLKFQVRYILRTEPDINGDYLYSCWLINGQPENENEEFKYHESNLLLFRKGTKRELNDFLKITIEEENYELAQAIKLVIDKCE